MGPLRLLIGHDEDGKPVELTEQDLETHVHGIGAPRTGKSKLLEWIAQELFVNGEPFCLIDPHGQLWNALVRWLAYLRPKRKVRLLNPSYPGRVVGFNPFRLSKGHISAQVDRMVRATVKAFGEANSDQTPRLERRLRGVYHALIEARCPVDFSTYLLTFKHQAVREHLIRAISSRTIRDQWEELNALERLPDFYQQVESAMNRLTRFVECLPVKRAMASWDNVIDLDEIIENGETLLVNLQPSADLTRPEAELFGTLLLDKFWDVASRRQEGSHGEKPSRYFLLIDEFQKFLVPDIAEMLNESPKFGLRLFLFHQHLWQLRQKDPEAYGAVMTGAQTKLVFGGLSREDAQIMAGEMFAGQIDFTEVRHIVEQTKFWPLYVRDKVYTMSFGKASSRLRSRGAAGSTGKTWNPALEQWAETVVSTSTEGDAEGDVDTSQESVADVPGTRHIPFKESSSVELYQLQDQLWRLADRLKLQYQKHYFLRRPGQKTIPAEAPLVETRYVRSEDVLRYVEDVLEGFLTPAEVDAALEETHQKLLAQVRRGGEFRPEQVWALPPVDTPKKEK
jgi:hypothetical protein